MSDLTEKARHGAPAEDDAPAPTAGAAGEAAPAAEAAAPPVARAEFDALRAERDELLNSLVRLQADFENYRKRIERDRAAEHHRAVASAIEPILPVLDDFERALETHRDPGYEKFRQGFDLIYRRLWAALHKLGLRRIEAAGKAFDPHLHQAVERVETREHADGAVLGELAPGYQFHERVLRPAMVRVAVHPAAPRDEA
ncbi:MAG TPA: nucleotide exchange factor GrpE [Candidatus Acidoferrales bacterium]|nr:nucleotide exchange factor GrpE [Candidatus Acidoferrales bacterium]